MNMMDSEKDNEMIWEVEGSEYLFRRPWLTVRRDKVRLPNGTVHPEYYVLEYPKWINVIAITPEGNYVMVKQYRHGLGIVETELCAGVVEEGEEPLAAARRELLEETGFGGGEWELLSVLSPNPGSQNNLSYSFIARGVEKIDDQHLDDTEDIRVEILTEQQLINLLTTDTLKQALMVAPLWKYFALNRCKK